MYLLFSASGDSEPVHVPCTCYPDDVSAPLTPQVMTAIAELWDTLRSCQQGDLAPVLIAHGITSISALRRRVDDLQAAGIPQWKLECILAMKADPVGGRRTDPGRADLPRAWQGKRASLQSALNAAQPNQRQRALQDLEDDMMARSTNPAMESRLRTYRVICDAWEIEPFPLSMTNVRAFGASMKQGGYRSASVYYQTLCTFQQRNLSTEVTPLVRRCIRDCVRSIRRGLGASTLKDAFDGRLLGQLDVGDDDTPFNMDNPFHARDVCVIGMWCMLREQELAGARLGHLTLSGQEVCLSIPIHKTDIYGSLCERRLKCSCLVRQHGLCVWHASERHLIRMGQRSDIRASVLTPLFPTGSGQTASKQQFILMMRKVIASTGTDTMRADPQGNHKERFAGHTLRVTGAQLMASCGVPVQLIQLLGRWASSAIQRYIQESPMTQIPNIPLAVQQRNGDLLGPVVAPIIGENPIQSAASLEVPAAPERVEVPVPATPLTDPDLQSELQSLKASILRPSQAYVARYRSRVLHYGSMFELDNPPNTWRTRCGWSYGVTNFIRLSEIPAGGRKCHKCFALSRQPDQQADAQDDEDSSSSVTSSSDASSD